MTQLILTISLKRLSSLNPKGFYYSYPWSCSLSGKRTSFRTGLSLENCEFLLMFSTAFTSLSVLILFSQFWRIYSVGTDRPD